jgi:hypothetical protein
MGVRHVPTMAVLKRWSARLDPKRLMVDEVILRQ